VLFFKFIVEIILSISLFFIKIVYYILYKFIKINKIDKNKKILMSNLPEYEFDTAIYKEYLRPKLKGLFEKPEGKKTLIID